MHMYSITISYMYLAISISIKRSAKRLFANSSHECRRIETKLSQPMDAIPDLNLRGSACAKKLPPRSARRKTLNQPTSILDLRRKYVVFCARSFACNAKEKSQRLFTNSSRERRRIATKLSQPSNAVPHLNLRGSVCANKLLPRSAALPEHRSLPKTGFSASVYIMCRWYSYAK